MTNDFLQADLARVKVERDMLRADQAALMAALRECGYLARHPDDTTAQKISACSARVLANPERHNGILAERDQARTDAAVLRAVCEATLEYWQATGFAECELNCDCIVDQMRAAVSKTQEEPAP